MIHQTAGAGEVGRLNQQVQEVPEAQQPGQDAKQVNRQGVDGPVHPAKECGPESSDGHNGESQLTAVCQPRTAANLSRPR